MGIMCGLFFRRHSFACLGLLFFLWGNFSRINAQNNVLALDGVDDYVSLPATNGMLNQTSGSIGFDVRLQSVGRAMTLLAVGDQNNEEVCFHVDVLADGTLAVVGRTGNGEYALCQWSTTFRFEVWQWYRVSVVQNGSGVRAYIDGLPIAMQRAGVCALEADPGAWFADLTSADTISLGAKVSAQHQTFAHAHVHIDGVILWNQALSAFDVDRYGKGILSLSNSSVKLRYDFQSGMPDDLSGNQNEGALENGALVIDEPAQLGNTNVLCLDGSNDYMDLPVAPFRQLRRGSLLMWVKFDSLEGRQALFSMVDPSHEHRYFAIQKTKDNRLSVGLKNQRFPGFLFNRESRSFRFQQDAWYQVGITQSDEGVKVYVNGAPVSMERGKMKHGEIDRKGWFHHVPHGSRVTLGGLRNRSGGVHAHVRLDKVQVWKRGLSPAEMQLNYIQRADLNDSDLLAYYDFEVEDGSDSSGNGHHGTLFGGTTKLDALLVNPLVDNGVICFDGIDDLGSLRPDMFVDQTSGTVSMWVKYNSITSVSDVLFSVTQLSDNYRYLKIQRLGSRNSLLFVARHSSSGYNVIQETTTFDFDVGVWYHLAVVQDGTHPKIYVNGEEAAIANVTGIGEANRGAWFDAVPGGDTVSLGAAYKVGGQLYADSCLDNLAIWDRPLTAEEVYQEYRGSLDHEEASLLAFYDFNDEGIFDRTGNENHGTLIGANFGSEEIDREQPTEDNVIALDGVNDYVTLHPDAIADHTEGAVTFFAQLRSLGSPMTLYSVCSSADPLDCLQLTVQSSGTLRAEHSNASGVDMCFETVARLDVSTWYHLSMVREGNQIKLFVNGREEPTFTCSSGPDVALWNNDVVAADRVTIGARLLSSSTYTGFAHAYIDDFMIWSRPLSNSEVNDAAIGILDLEDPGLEGLYRFNLGQVIDETGNGNDGVAHGAAFEEFGDTTAVFDNNVVALNGVDGFLNIPAGDLLAQETGAISFWVKSARTNETECLFSVTTAGSSSGYFQVHKTAGGYLQILADDGAAQTMNVKSIRGNLTPIDFWVHLTLRQDGSGVQAVVNGLSVDLISELPIGTQNDSAWFHTASGDTVAFGAAHLDVDRYFAAVCLDEVKIWDRPLSRAEILGNFTKLDKSSENQGLLVCYNFNNGMATDESGLGNDGLPGASAGFVRDTLRFPICIDRRWNESICFYGERGYLYQVQSSLRWGNWFNLWDVIEGAGAPISIPVPDEYNRRRAYRVIVTVPTLP